MIPKTSNNYREISEKRRPVVLTIASGLVAIKVIWVAICQRPFDLRIRVAAIAFSSVQSENIIKCAPAIAAT